MRLRDRKIEREKLNQLALFTGLKMPQAINAVERRLDETNGNPPKQLRPTVLWPV
jgi:hypothetical protein